MLEIIQAVLIVGIMFIFSFYILRNLVKRIDQNVKRYFLQTLQEYNYLVDEKQKEYDEIVERLEQIKAKSKIVEMLEKNDEELLFDNEIEYKLLRMKEYKEKLRIKEEQLKREASGIGIDMKPPKYKEEGFFYNYKELREKFKLDNRDVIENFLKVKTNKRGSVKKQKEFNILKKYKEQFTPKVTYDLLTFTAKEQYDLVKQVTKKDVENLVGLEKRFLNKNKFNIVKLIEYVDLLIKECDPTIYIYVGIRDLNYNHLNENIKTCFYKNMSEGIMIIYQGQVYDYSI